MYRLAENIGHIKTVLVLPVTHLEPSFIYPVNNQKLNGNMAYLSYNNSEYKEIGPIDRRHYHLVLRELICEKQNAQTNKPESYN